MATKNIEVIKNGVTTTLDNFVYNGISCDKVYVRTSADDEWILVFEKGGQIISMAIKISAGNWKMNPATLNSAIDLVNSFKNLITVPNDCKCIVFPPTCFIGQVATALQGTSIEVGCQRISSAASGAYSGQVSASQVASLGATWVIVGTSEARGCLGDTDQECSNQAAQALAQDLKVIYFVGENLDERDAGQTESVLTTQLSALFNQVSSGDFLEGKIAIAYEPIWAIGTGRAITPEQAQTVCAFIRGLINNTMTAQAASVTPILFVNINKNTSAEIAGQLDIDGGVAGGAALRAADFVTITDNIFNS